MEILASIVSEKRGPKRPKECFYYSIIVFPRGNCFPVVLFGEILHQKILHFCIRKLFPREKTVIFLVHSMSFWT